ncbi:MAG TPA: carbohydrate kinase family protein [Candidatus Thermoplasmatota archaeon]|nr:carbohydrate kinase family protein [Candidatus Thermoplasmatota archaeon]
MIDVTGTVALDMVGRVRRLPGMNVTARVDDLARDWGGAAGNVAMGLARLGLPVRLSAVVGEDFAGGAYEQAFLAARVDLAGLVRAPGPTAHAFMFCDPEGHQQIYFYPGPEASLTEGPAFSAELAHFTTGDCTDYPRRMRLAERVTFDPGQEVFHRDLKGVEACLPEVDVLFLNEFEAAHLREHIGLVPERLVKEGLEAVVITHGMRGQMVITPDAHMHVPAVPAKAVDPTGAGDAHRVGFLLGMSRGLPFVECARLGAVTAAFAVEAMGPQRGLPTLQQVRERYARAFGPCPV